MDQIPTRGIVDRQVHVARPAAAGLLGRFVPLEIILTVDLAPDGNRDLVIPFGIPHGDLHGAVIRCDGSHHLRRLHVIELGHLSHHMTRHTHGVGISGAGVGMDLVVAGGMMLRQVNIAGPSPIRLYRIVPGQIILSVLHAPNCELDLGVAVAGHIDHLDSQDVVVLYRRHSVILLGPANDILRAAAVVALSDLRLRANAVVRAGRVVGELVGHVLDYIDPIARDDARAVIGVDLISSQILIIAHGNCDDPLAVLLLYAAEPLHVVLSIVLTPHGDSAVCEGLAFHGREDDRQYAAVFTQAHSDRTPHPAFRVKVIAGTVDALPPGDHRAVVGGVLLGVEIIRIITNFRHAEGHLAVVIIVGLAVGLLDKTSMTANYQAIFEHKGHFVHYLLTVVGHTVLVEAVVVLFHQEPAGLRDALHEEHLAAGGLVTSPAVIVPLDGVNGGMAVIADQLAAAANSIRQLMALFGAAAGEGHEGQAVQKLLAAVGQNVVDVDRHLGLGRFHAQIDRVEAVVRLCEDLRVIKDILTVDLIGFLAAGTADVVIHAVLGVDLAALQGVGAGKGVVMAGEHHINAGRLRRRRDILIHRSVAALGICVIGGLVDREDLPGSIAVLGIPHQPLRRRLHIAGIAAVVDDGHIDVAIGGGPAAAHTVFGQGEHAAGDVGIAVALKLMVAQNVDHVGAAQLLRVQQFGHLIQLGEIGRSIHCVASLDAEVVAAGSQLFENMGDIGHIIGLDVAQHEELLGRTGRADGEALRRLRPVVTGGHLIFIGCACGQASQRDAVHVHRVIAACNKGTQLRCRRSDGNPVLSPLHTVAQELFLRYRRIGQPGDVLRRAYTLRGVKEERGLRDRHRIVGIDLIAHGQASIGVLSVDGDHACSPERITGQHTLFICTSQLLIVVSFVNLCVGYRLALQVCDRQDGIPIGEHRSAGHTDSRAHRQRHLGGGEGHQIAVHVVAHTGLDLVEERTAGRQAGGYLHPHRGDQVAILDRTATGAHGADSNSTILCLVAFGGVIVGCRGEIGGERHGAVTKLSIQTDDRVALADIAACTPDLQCHIAAHGSHGLHVGHTDGVFHAAVRHSKVPGLGGLVAEAVAERHRDGVCAVGKLQVIQVYVLIALVYIGLLRHIDTVHIETHGIIIYPSGILTRRVAEIGAQIEVAAVDRAAINQLLVVEGNGVHLRVVNIVRIRAVHKLEVIQIDRPDPGFYHVSAIDKHEAEGHTLLQGERCSRCIQLGLAVFPAFPVDTGLIVSRISV